MATADQRTHEDIRREQRADTERRLADALARVAALEAALRGVQTTSRWGCWCDASYAATPFSHQPKCLAAKAALGVSLDSLGGMP